MSSGERIADYSYAQWKVYQIKGVLRHYGVYHARENKAQLWEKMKSLIERRNIREEQLLEIHDNDAESSEPRAKKRRIRKEAAEKSKTAECIVCFEQFNPANKRKKIVTTTCTHDPDVCPSCYSSSINSQMAGKSWDLLSCPSCNSRLGFNEIQALARPADFARYDAYLLERSLDSMTGPRFQRCRHAGCSSGQQCYPEDDSFIICKGCKQKTCISCDVIWHTDMSCEEAKAQREADQARHKSEEEASNSYKQKKTTACPKCHIPGEKMYGCDHMSCPMCRHEYCWLCQANYRDIRKIGNTAHKATCQYHSSRIPDPHGRAHPLDYQD